MTKMRVVSYNVHEWLGTDGRRDFERTVGVLRKVGADIMGLQEVSFDAPSTSNAVDKLDRAFPGFRVIRGTTLARRESHFGNVLVTRYSVTRLDRHDISIIGREPRGILDVELNVNGTRIRVLVTHFGRRMHERTQQARACTRLLESNRYIPVIILSDFNEWMPFAPSMRIFGRLFNKTRYCPTFPSALPLLPLDRIWTTDAVSITSIEALHSKTARVASDHLPLVAAVDLPNDKHL